MAGTPGHTIELPSRYCQRHWGEPFHRLLKGIIIETAGVFETLIVQMNATEASEETSFHWNAPRIVLSVILFLAAGLCEIGGGWLVWKAVRGGLGPSRYWYKSQKALVAAALGGVVLVGYGFLPTLQPPPTFGRLYAVYGGFFIILSYLWGWGVDKERPDKGSCISPPL